MSEPTERPGLYIMVIIAMLASFQAAEKTTKIKAQLDAGAVTAGCAP